MSSPHTLDSGTLYVVATPIGNRQDISQRAIQILQNVDIILAEDTRHSRYLLTQWGINTRCKALHEHNEKEVSECYIEILLAGQSIALISDAGTPLISDPGYYFLTQIHAKNITVVPVPGASAMLAALSVSGLATHHFTFVGFLSAKSAARKKQLLTWQKITHTLIFYEAPHRIVASLHDMCAILGEERKVLFARELTKTFETIQRHTLQSLYHFVVADSNQQRGEIVIIVEGMPSSSEKELPAQSCKTLEVLLQDLPLKQAVKLAVALTGERKKALYQYALEWKERQ